VRLGTIRIRKLSQIALAEPGACRPAVCINHESSGTTFGRLKNPAGFQ
jgi:hypothetical protein